MKKLLIIGIIAMFFGLAFIPSFNAVSISKSDNTTPIDIKLQYELEKYNDKWLYIFTATCSGGANRVDFTFDDLLQDTVTGPGPEYVWQFLTSKLIRGHTICAIAYDGSGNNESDCIEFRSRSLDIESTDDCFECQSNGKTHLAEKIINRLQKNEVFKDIINFKEILNNPFITKINPIIFKEFSNKINPIEPLPPNFFKCCTLFGKLLTLGYTWVFLRGIYLRLDKMGYKKLSSVVSNIWENINVSFFQTIDMLYDLDCDFLV